MVLSRLGQKSMLANRAGQQWQHVPVAPPAEIKPVEVEAPRRPSVPTVGKGVARQASTAATPPVDVQPPTAAAAEPSPATVDPDFGSPIGEVGCAAVTDPDTGARVTTRSVPERNYPHVS